MEQVEKSKKKKKKLDKLIQGWTRETTQRRDVGSGQT